MNINDLDTSKTPVETKEPVTPDQISKPIQQELEVGAFTDVLGLTSEESSKYHDKIDTLIEWAKTKTDDHSVENLKWVIRELGFDLGTPPLGQKLVNWLAEYAYLSKESETIKKQLDKMKHDKN